MDKKEYREDFLKRIKEAEGKDFKVKVKKKLETTRVALEFLLTEKNCNLISNEITYSQLCQIGQKFGVTIINGRNKLFLTANSSDEVVHYIDYKVEDE